MTLRFRNLDFDSTAPLDQWPAEAIQTVIDRGSLSDWHQLTAAIRRHPWGPAARTTETVIAWDEHYGIDALLSRVIRHSRADIALQGRAEYAAQIRSWRTQAGMTLRQFARAAGTSASRLSDYEHAKVSPTTDVLGRLKHVAEHRWEDIEAGLGARREASTSGDENTTFPRLESRKCLFSSPNQQEQRP
jgi:transcriptional regulator with XRE-family HTH domain